MKTRRAKQKPDSAPVWERAEPQRRPAPRPLSRERIVQTAIELADAEGLSAVSLRKVGAALDAGPMRLYGYLSTKEELLDLMVDAVYGELLGPIRGDFREALRALATRIRKAAAQHLWFGDLLGGRIHLGPNALAYMESCLAAISGSPGFEHVDTALQAVATVHAYVIGAIRVEMGERRAEQESGMNKSQWQQASAPYLQRMLATGRFPTLEKVMRDANHLGFDEAFANGLECVLDGIAARLPSSKKPRAR